MKAGVLPALSKKKVKLLATRGTVVNTTMSTTKYTNTIFSVGTVTARPRFSRSVGRVHDGFAGCDVHVSVALDGGSAVARGWGRDATLMERQAVRLRGAPHAPAH